MIKPEQIRELLTAAPFRPFRIWLSDGSSYDIVNHDMAMVTRNTVEIGIHPDPSGIAERVARCAIMHIVKVEEMQPA